MNLKPVVNITDWDGIKLFPHDLWTNDVRDLIKKCFGSLVVELEKEVESSIHYSTMEDFRNLYIPQFEDHFDEIEDLSNEIISTFITKEHLACYDEIMSWAKKGQAQKIKIDINRLMYEGYPEARRIVKDRNEAGQLLCGRRGAGKTSLILYNMDLEKKVGKFIYIKINMDKVPVGSADKSQYLKEQLVWALDNAIDKITTVSDDQYIIERYLYYWKGILGNLMPSEDDSNERKLEKRKRREDYLFRLSELKYSLEFINYLRCSISYLEKTTGKSVVLAIDDIDQMESHAGAREIIDLASNIQEQIQRPLVIAIREETISRIESKPSVDKLQRISVFPPSFKKILQLRLEAFTREVICAKELDTSHYSRSELITYVTTIINSVNEKNAYPKLVTFHYDMDMLLDMVQCLLSSPYLQPVLVLERAARGKNIAWHLMLNSFQKYDYRNHYEQNSFFLNMYDNRSYGTEISDNSQITWENALVRIRLLSLLVNRLVQSPPVSKYPSFSLRFIIDDMIRLGYQENEVIKALKALAAHRIIRTGKARNELEVDGTISISTAAIFYYDYLIYEYRYLQNILLITPIDFHFNPEDIPDSPETKDLPKIDEIIYNFANFIERCEKLEAKSPDLDSKLLRKIWRGRPLSDKIRQTISMFKERRV